MEFKGSIYLGEDITDRDLFQLLPDDLKGFYEDVNGIVAFQGGLHIRGCVLEPAWHSLRQVWKGEWALHRHFSNLLTSDIPFAQDCLGDQFFLRMGSVWRLIVDTGDVEDLEIELYDFFEDAEHDPVDFLDLEPLVLYLEDGHEVKPGYLLAADPPFTIEADEYQLKTVSVSDFMQNLGHLPL